VWEGIYRSSRFTYEEMSKWNAFAAWIERRLLLFRLWLFVPPTNRWQDWF
jgi:hypothetical protein